MVLASGSPRRKELLALAGYEFEVKVAGVDESLREGEGAKAYVERLAVEKARAVAVSDAEAVVIGADTTVVLEGDVLGKPVDVADAERMLRMLSGKTHQVYTGVAVVRGETVVRGVVTTEVTFREIGEEELRVYLKSGDAMDKAGAYGIQGYATRWIPRIEGDYFNVVGLPVSAVVGMVGQIL